MDNTDESVDSAALPPDSSHSEEEQTTELQSSTTSQPSLPRDPLPELSFKDPLFPYSQPFTSKPRRERELLFIRAFEEQTLFIRNKELRCTSSPADALLSTEAAQNLFDSRQGNLDALKRSEERRLITRHTTESSRTPAPRVEVTAQSSFNPLLNVHFESQFSLLETFKDVVSELLTRTRAQRRAQLLSQFLLNARTNAVKSLQDKLEEQRMLTANSLLSLKIEFGRPMPKFATPYQMEPPVAPEIAIDPHQVQRSFKMYNPAWVERYQLSPFVRTDVTTYVAAPISPPETFPVVREEQPIRERIVPSLSLDDPTLKEPKAAATAPLAPVPIARIVQYPRETRYYTFDPSYSLRPQPVTLPELPDEIGRSSLLALSLAEYEKMSMTGKTKAPFAPFEFIGVPNIAEAGLTSFSGANAIDLRELEPDDDIDGIDVQPKVRPVTDFLSKSVSAKNKSHVLAEAVAEGQSHWRDRQRKGAHDLAEKQKALNGQMRDKSLTLPLDDLLEYLKQ
jgi:hypothetical protein